MHFGDFWSTFGLRMDSLCLEPKCWNLVPFSSRTFKPFLYPLHMHLHKPSTHFHQQSAQKPCITHAFPAPPSCIPITFHMHFHLSSTIHTLSSHLPHPLIIQTYTHSPPEIILAVHMHTHFISATCNH